MIACLLLIYRVNFPVMIDGRFDKKSKMDFHVRLMR